MIFFWRKTEWKQLIKKTAYFLPPLIVYAGLRYYALGSDYFISTNAYSFFNPIKDIFESSEVPEKRALLQFLLQNPTVKGKTLSFELKKSFNFVLNLA